METPAVLQQAVREYLVTLDDRIAAIERVLDPTLAQQKSLQDKLSRLGRIYVDALIGEREYTEQRAGIEAALAKLSVGSAVRVDELNELRVLRNKWVDFELVLDLKRGPDPWFRLRFSEVRERRLSG